MKMDDRDSAECQNWRNKGQNWHFSNFLSDTKDKARIVLVFFKTKESKKRELKQGACSGRLKLILEREPQASL